MILDFCSEVYSLSGTLIQQGRLKVGPQLEVMRAYVNGGAMGKADKGSASYLQEKIEN